MSCSTEWTTRDSPRATAATANYYEAVPIEIARTPQALLALEMNRAPLPVEHGAPVRIRLETQLGYKMVKWVKAIEFVDDPTRIGMGQGGYREDQLFYANAPGI